MPNFEAVRSVLQSPPLTAVSASKVLKWIAKLEKYVKVQEDEIERLRGMVSNFEQALAQDHATDVSYDDLAAAIRDVGRGSMTLDEVLDLVPTEIDTISQRQ